jgi:hypothetical protein
VTVLKADGGEEWQKWNFVIVWIQEVKWGKLLFTFRQY